MRTLVDVPDLNFLADESTGSALRFMQFVFSKAQFFLSKHKKGAKMSISISETWKPNLLFKATWKGQTVLAKKLETSKTTRELEILTALQDNAHIAHLVIRDVVDGHVVFENAANTLERLLKSRNEPLDEAVGFRISVGIARALHYSHMAGVYLRELPVDMIILDNDFSPRLLQFADSEIAVVSEDDPSSPAKVLALKQADFRLFASFLLVLMSFGKNLPPVSSKANLEIPDQVPASYKAVIELCTNSQFTSSNLLDFHMIEGLLQRIAQDEGIELPEAYRWPFELRKEIVWRKHEEQRRKADSVPIEISPDESKERSPLLKQNLSLLSDDTLCAVREGAIKAIAELELVNDSVKKSLESTLKKDSEWVVREQAAKAIGRLRVSELADALSAVLLSDSWLSVRWECAKSLSVLGQKAAQNNHVVESLIKSLSSEVSWYVRKFVVKAIIELELDFNNESTLKSLCKALENDKDEWVRRECALALGQIGSPSATVRNEVINALINALRNDKHIVVRKQAAHSLGIIGGENAFISLIEGPPEFCWPQAPVALIRTPWKKAIDVVSKFIKNPPKPTAAKATEQQSPNKQNDSKSTSQQTQPQNKATEKTQTTQPNTSTTNGPPAGISPQTIEVIEYKPKAKAPLSPSLSRANPSPVPQAQQFSLTTLLTTLKSAKTGADRVKAIKVLSEVILDPTLKISSSDIEEALTGLLNLVGKDGESSVRAAAARSLEKLLVLENRGRVNPSKQQLQAVPQALCSALSSDSDEYVRLSCAATLRTFAETADDRTQQQMRTSLLSALNKDDKWGVREEAAKSLGALTNAADDDVTDALCTVLQKDTNRDVRSAAARSLGELKTITEPIVRCLCGSLQQDTVGFVRKEAALAIGELAIEHEEVVQVVCEALVKDKDWYVREAAAKALRSLHITSADVVKCLFRALTADPVWNVQKEAAESIGILNIQNERVVQALLDQLAKNSDKQVRKACTINLGRLIFGAQFSDFLAPVAGASNANSQDTNKANKAVITSLQKDSEMMKKFDVAFKRDIELQEPLRKILMVVNKK